MIVSTPKKAKYEIDLGKIKAKVALIKKDSEIWRYPGDEVHQKKRFAAIL